LIKVARKLKVQNIQMPVSEFALG